MRVLLESIYFLSKLFPYFFYRINNLVILKFIGYYLKEMFIIKSGVLESLSFDNTVLKTFREGSIFGELSILKMIETKKSNHRVQALRSVGYSEVYILRQEDVLYVLKDYPEARKNLVIKGTL